MKTLAALATVPGREEALEKCLLSLRNQVDEIRVICHDVTVPPNCVRQIASSFICERDRRGSAAKLHWAREWDGMYLGCDDDFLYPTDYVDTMRHWIEQWNRKALVTCHGRVMKHQSKSFEAVNAAWPPRGENDGAWINYPGGCAMAFHTDLRVPNRVPGKNLEEVHLAVWAQRQRVPIWLVPHTSDFLQYLLPDVAGIPTIWSTEKKVRFINRNRVLAPQGRRGWRIYECSTKLSAIS